ncbi:MAG: hypothetical protein IV092_01450 [Burkholderiaceae bacterium]|nr:hypothetical protein [Burkholderiaceae bacterium]
MKNLAHAFKRACMTMLVFGLAACGGGGGGGDTTAAPTGTGLIPPAPSLGETIHADAAVLRPLRAGATWVYRGQDRPYPNAAVQTYIDTVTHAATADGVKESGSNPFNNGEDATTLSAGTGTILSLTADLGIGATPTPLSIVELRSPVRVNDQYTVLDKHFDDAGSDVDGDKKNDSVDIGIYRRVVGTEDIQPENLPLLRTVRVDMVVLARFKYSSNGQTSPVLQLGLQSAWYAPGVGVVRQRLQLPSTTSGDRIAEETLISWDGVSEGLGYTTPHRATVPADAGEFAGQWLPSPRAAIAFDQHAVLMTGHFNVNRCCYAVLSTMDLRGKLTGIQVHEKPANFMPTDFLFRNGNELAWIHASQLNGFLFSVVRFDASGKLLGPAQGAPLELRSSGEPAESVTSVTFASDATGIWAVWVRRHVVVNGNSVTMSEQLVAQKFDFSGKAITQEVQIKDWGRMIASNVRVTAVVNAHQLAVSWRGGPDVGAQAISYAVLAAPFSQPVLKLLTPELLANELLVDLGSSVGFLWSAPYQWTGSIDPNRTTLAYGARLDTAANPVLTTGNLLSNEALSRSWGGPLLATAGAAVSENGASLLVFAPVYDKFWADEGYSGGVNVLAELSLAGTQPLSLASAKITRLPGSTSSGPWDKDLQYVRRILVFPGRVLVFGGYESALVTSVVWRR